LRTPKSRYFSSFVRSDAQRLIAGKEFPRGNSRIAQRGGGFEPRSAGHVFQRFRAICRAVWQGFNDRRDERRMSFHLKELRAAAWGAPRDGNLVELETGAFTMEFGDSDARQAPHEREPNAIGS